MQRRDYARHGILSKILEFCEPKRNELNCSPLFPKPIVRGGMSTRPACLRKSMTSFWAKRRRQSKNDTALLILGMVYRRRPPEKSVGTRLGSGGHGPPC